MGMKKACLRNLPSCEKINRISAPLWKQEEQLPPAAGRRRSDGDLIDNRLEM